MDTTGSMKTRHIAMCASKCPLRDESVNYHRCAHLPSPRALHVCPAQPHTPHRQLGHILVVPHSCFTHAFYQPSGYPHLDLFSPDYSQRLILRSLSISASSPRTRNHHAVTSLCPVFKRPWLPKCWILQATVLLARLIF